MLTTLGLSYASLFWLGAFCIPSGSSDDGSNCPFLCTCLGQFIDCSGKRMLNLPYNLPVWVTSL